MIEKETSDGEKGNIGSRKRKRRFSKKERDEIGKNVSYLLLFGNLALLIFCSIFDVQTYTTYVNLKTCNGQLIHKIWWIHCPSQNPDHVFTRHITIHARVYYRVAGIIGGHYVVIGCGPWIGFAHIIEHTVAVRVRAHHLLIFVPHMFLSFLECSGMHKNI